MITIPLHEYQKLLDDSRFLDCLNNTGVDNWDGYDEAVTEFNSQED